MREADAVSLWQLGRGAMPPALPLNLVLHIDLAWDGDGNLWRKSAAAEARKHVMCSTLARTCGERHQVVLRKLDGRSRRGARDHGCRYLQPRRDGRLGRYGREARRRLGDLDLRRFGGLLGWEPKAADTSEQGSPGSRAWLLWFGLRSLGLGLLCASGCEEGWQAHGWARRTLLHGYGDMATRA